MPRSIVPVELRLAQLLGEEKPQPSSPVGIGAIHELPQSELVKSPFENILGKAVEALEGVSKEEIKANQLIDAYLKGNAELSDVMVQSSKLSILVQMAVTTLNSAVGTFKEITQMQV